MASRSVVVYTSDLTSKEIQHPDELAELRVLDHPKLSKPVRLDAYVLELQSFLDADHQFVTLEIVLPGQSLRRVVVPLEAFNRVFTADVDAVLGAAEVLSGASAKAESRGRSVSTTKTTAAGPATSREQRGAVRDWANSNGFHVGDRGRIKAEVLEAFEAAH